jgi:menaquinone-9 beta-reductase
VEAAEYDLAVIGAGPAGSSCSISTARSGARVLLLEKDRFPRHKVCGEFVSAESLRLLQWLLGGPRFAEKPELSLSRIFYGEKAITLPVSPAARSISRFELDKALFGAVREAGICAREEITVRSVTREQNLFHIHTAEEKFTARAVVNASGRWSQLTQFPALQEKWIGLKAHFTEANAPSSMDLYFFEQGYCGVSTVGPQTINTCAMVRAGAARTLEEVFAQHPLLWQRSRGWQMLFPAITTSPLYFRDPQIVQNGMLQVGDAANFIDPFAGDGISLALHTGWLAAHSLRAFLQGKATLDEACNGYTEYYQKKFASVFRGVTWVRRALASPPCIRFFLLRLAGTKPVAKFLVNHTRIRMNEYGYSE